MPIIFFMGSRLHVLLYTFSFLKNMKLFFSIFF